MTHNELALNLAAHLRSVDRMVWCDVQLGPSGSVRPDVYTIFKSYVRPCPTAYEVKVSMSDFRADVTSGKWQSYLKYSSGVYFACEAGLIAPKDLPEHCGLIVLKNAWRITKKAVLSPVTIPQDAFLKLLISHIDRCEPPRRDRGSENYWRLRHADKKFGDIVAATIRDRDAVEHEIESARYTAKRIIEDAQKKAECLRQDETKRLEPVRREVCQILGITEDSQVWTIKAEVQKLRQSLEENPAVEKLRMMTQAIRNTLERYEHKERAEELEMELP